MALSENVKTKENEYYTIKFLLSKNFLFPVPWTTKSTRAENCPKIRLLDANSKMAHYSFLSINGLFWGLLRLLYIKCFKKMANFKRKNSMAHFGVWITWIFRRLVFDVICPKKNFLTGIQLNCTKAAIIKPTTVLATTSKSMRLFYWATLRNLEVWLIFWLNKGIAANDIVPNVGFNG